MAEEAKPTGDDPPAPSPKPVEPPSKPAEPPEVARKEPAASAPTEPPEPRVDCPDCAADVRQSQLALHRWKAHAHDRREVKDDKQAKPTRERKPAPTTTPDDDGKEPVKASRWAEVRKGWR